MEKAQQPATVGRPKIGAVTSVTLTPANHEWLDLWPENKATLIRELLTSHHNLHTAPLYDLVITDPDGAVSNYFAEAGWPYRPLAWDGWQNEINDIADCYDNAIINEDWKPGNSIEFGHRQGATTIAFAFRSFLPGDIGAWTYQISKPVDDPQTATSDDLWVDSVIWGAFHSHQSALDDFDLCISDIAASHNATWDPDSETLVYENGQHARVIIAASTKDYDDWGNNLIDLAVEDAELSG